MEENKIIGKIGFDPETGSAAKEPIFVTLSSYKNFKYVDIRKFYNENNEWKPTKKGITMNIEQIDNFIALIQEHRTEIEEWFKS